MLFTKIFEISFIETSDNITTDKPVTNVKIRNFKYIELSLDLKKRKKGISIKSGM